MPIWWSEVFRLLKQKIAGDKIFEKSVHYSIMMLEESFSACYDKDAIKIASNPHSGDRPSPRGTFQKERGYYHD